MANRATHRLAINTDCDVDDRGDDDDKDELILKEEEFSR